MPETRRASDPKPSPTPSSTLPFEGSSPESVFEQLDAFELETMHFCSDPASQLKSIIAIHNTALGPALGGCRCISYESEPAAILDVARLARGMSYKAALAGVPQGGGKAVILKPKGKFDRNALYRSFGEFVDTLGGRYITAIDSGTHLEDMDQVAKVTPHVAGSHSDGLDPSPVTALGVYAGLKAAVKNRLQESDLKGLRVAIQGLGNVGYALAKKLHSEGAILFVADIDAAKVRHCVEEFGATAVSPETITTIECEVFSPCGLGAIVNDLSYEKFKCSVIAGSANNQLAEPYHGKLLHERRILYAPDYVINAGGLINVSLGNLKLPFEQIKSKTLGIGDTLNELFKRSDHQNRPTSELADQMAEELLEAAHQT